MLSTAFGMKFRLTKALYKGHAQSGTKRKCYWWNTLCFSDSCLLEGKNSVKRLESKKKK